MSLKNVLLDKFLEVDRLVVFLPIDEELGQISHFFNDKCWALRCEHLHISEVGEELTILL